MSGVEIAALDIGGGFPTAYAGQEAAALSLVFRHDQGGAATPWTARTCT